MHIVCLAKFIPDVDRFQYDYETHTLIRDKSEQVLNPDDAAALAYALDFKQARGDVAIELVTMGPESVLDSVRDLLRRGIDRATILSDRLFAGSDTYATAIVLGAYLKQSEFDLILTGTRALDGDTAQVPAQLAELLNLEHVSYIRSIDRAFQNDGKLVVHVEDEQEVLSYEINIPAVLGLTRDAPYRLPYVRYDDLTMYVDDRITVLDSTKVNLDADQTGQAGSLTKVARAYLKEQHAGEQIFVQVNASGVDRVYDFLVNEGYIKR